MGPGPDIASRHVRFTPQSGQSADMLPCPLRAKSDRTQRSKKRRYSVIWSARASSVGGTSRGIRGTERYGMSGIRFWNHSGLMPANFTTLPHFSVSSAISLPNSAGEPGSTVAPKSAKRALIIWSLRPGDSSGAFFLHRASIGLVKQAQAAAFFEPEIDHFVMAITSFEARVRHTTPHQTACCSRADWMGELRCARAIHVCLPLPPL